ncbi:hypothetical protein PH586_16440 [Pseudomonas sp. SA3-5]|uniref:Uncharacterized protein n=1 Tax=Pseudomonas aestuarii TaxID=3018340 RepID=A0ABT4XIF6_9PSED|nr:hypothetical protein [Pseudomonas aestuarii]MDA7087982.1 hypothetical protein [Pseudomonas aestuarii]
MKPQLLKRVATMALAPRLHPASKILLSLLSLTLREERKSIPIMTPKMTIRRLQENHSLKLMAITSSVGISFGGTAQIGAGGDQEHGEVE